MEEKCNETDKESLGVSFISLVQIPLPPSAPDGNPAFSCTAQKALIDP